MGLKKCPVCGEKFADTYKRCPFCEEELNPRRAKQPKRYEGGGRRLARRDYEEETAHPVCDEESYRPRRSADEETYRPRRSADEEEYCPRRSAPEREYREEDREYRGRRSRRAEAYDNYDDYDERYDDDYGDGYDEYDDDDRGSPWFKVVLVILIAIIIACLLYLFRGPIGNLIGGNDDPAPPASSMMSEGEPEPGDPDFADPDEGTEPDVQEPDGQEPDGSEPDRQDPPDEGQTEPGQQDPPAVTGTLTLSHEDVSIAGDEKFTLSARSGSGNVTYSSKDPSVATVNASGVVTGVKKGTTEITVKRGGESAVCVVRVKSNGTASANTGDGGAAAASVTLNREDMTLSAGETFVLKPQGVTAAVTWSTANSAVATVDGSGKVTAVAAGTTTVTASWDGHTAKCIVRVK